MNEKDNKSDKKSSTQQTVFGLELGIDIDKRVLRMISTVMLEVVVLLVAGYFLLLPRWSDVNKLRNDLSLRQTQLNNLNKKLEILRSFELEAIRYDKVLTGAFPVSKDVGLVLFVLRGLASEVGIEVIGYSVDPVIVDEVKKPVAFGTATAPGSRQTKTDSFLMEITIAGQALDIQRFLESANESLPIKVIENVVITQGEIVSEGSSEVLEMKLEIRNYFLPLTQNVNPSGLVRELSDEEDQLIETLLGYRSVALTSDGGVSGSVPLGNDNLFGL